MFLPTIESRNAQFCFIFNHQFKHIILPRNNIREDSERSEKSQPVEFCLLTGKSRGKNQTSSHPPFWYPLDIEFTSVNENPFSRCYICRELRKYVFFCVRVLRILLAAHISREKRALSLENPSTQPREASNWPHTLSLGRWLWCSKWDSLVRPVSCVPKVQN